MPFKQFYCLLASRQAVPFATDVPYNMDEAFVERANRMVAAWRSGGLEAGSLIAQADGTAAPRGALARVFHTIRGLVSR